MTLKDKIAVLKLAGFKVREDKGGGEWFVPRETTEGGAFLLGRDSYTHEESAWDSAWRYIQGAEFEEFDNEPWTHQNNL